MRKQARIEEEKDAIQQGAHLTAGERRALLEEIGQFALTLGQSLVSYADGTPGGNQEPPVAASSAVYLRDGALTSPYERLHFLIALWPELERALRAIARQPDSRSVTHIQATPLARAMGHAVTAAAVARAPRAASAWQRLQSPLKPAWHAAPSPSVDFAACYPASGIDPHRHQLGSTPISERAVTLTHNTWANRLTVTLLTRIEQEARQLGLLAAFSDASQEEQLAARLYASAARARRQPFLRDCPAFSTAEVASARSTDNALRCAPPYRVLYQVWRRLHHPLDFDWTDNPLLTLPALEPWQLYEIWCLLHVGAALCEAGWQLTGSTLLHITPQGLRLTPAVGRASRLEFRREEKKKGRKGEGETEKAQGRKQKSAETQSTIDNRQSTMSSLSLYYQPLFASANQRSVMEKGERADPDRARIREEAFDFGSRSHAMQPDMVLHWRERLIVLDPKFKPHSGPQDAQEDINKMHAYRDAIVRPERRGVREGPAVEAAWCLFPGAAPQNAEKNAIVDADSGGAVFAYPAASSQCPYGTAGVGAFRLRPGQPGNRARLAAFLTYLIEK